MSETKSSTASPSALFRQLKAKLSSLEKQMVKTKNTMLQLEEAMKNGSTIKRPGRPKKAASAKAKSATAKRRPGRPKKAASAKAKPATAKRKPGRPKKAASAKAKPATAKRKPGRPKKAASAKAKPATAKRKPGRPKKAASAKAKSATAKRRPGRPKKAASAKAKSATAKRRPGRPKKAVSAKAKTVRAKASSRTAKATKAKTAGRRKRATKFSEWDQFVIGTIKTAGYPLLSTELLGFAGKQNSVSGKPMSAADLKNKVARSLHKLANVKKMLAKVKAPGRGFYYATKNMMESKNKVKKEFKRS